MTLEICPGSAEPCATVTISGYEFLSCPVCDALLMGPEPRNGRVPLHQVEQPTEPRTDSTRGSGTD